jgi:hypothetical protein
VNIGDQSGQYGRPIRSVWETELVNIGDQSGECRRPIRWIYEANPAGV